MKPRIYWNVCPANGGLVFATEADATENSRIRDAIQDSGTWGEFRAAMPASEYQNCLDEYLEENEEEPGDDELFESSMIAGWQDGDYPEWLQSDMHLRLPCPVWSAIEDYAESQDSTLNGEYDYIEQDHLADILAALQDMGYEVVDGRAMSFY